MLLVSSSKSPSHSCLCSLSLLAAAVRAVNREFVYIENSSLGAKLAKFGRQLSPNLAHLGATWAILAPT